MRYPERHVVTALHTADGELEAALSNVIGLLPEAVVAAAHKDVNHSRSR